MAIISVRVGKELKEKLDKYDVNVSETVRELLEEHVRDRELRDLGKRLDALKERLAGKIDVKTVAWLIREDRERS